MAQMTPQHHANRNLHLDTFQFGQLFAMLPSDQAESVKHDSDDAPRVSECDSVQESGQSQQVRPDELGLFSFEQVCAIVKKMQTAAPKMMHTGGGKRLRRSFGQAAKKLGLRGGRKDVDGLPHVSALLCAVQFNTWQQIEEDLKVPLEEHVVAKEAFSRIWRKMEQGVLTERANFARRKLEALGMAIQEDSFDRENFRYEVTDVFEGSLAAKAGVEAGAMLLGIGKAAGTRIESVLEKDSLSSASPGVVEDALANTWPLVLSLCPVASSIALTGANVTWNGIYTCQTIAEDVVVYRKDANAHILYVRREDNVYKHKWALSELPDPDGIIIFTQQACSSFDPTCIPKEWEGTNGCTIQLTLSATQKRIVHFDGEATRPTAFWETYIEASCSRRLTTSAADARKASGAKGRVLFRDVDTAASWHLSQEQIETVKDLRAEAADAAALLRGSAFACEENSSCLSSLLLLSRKLAPDSKLISEQKLMEHQSDLKQYVIGTRNAVQMIEEALTLASMLSGVDATHLQECASKLKEVLTMDWSTNHQTQSGVWFVKRNTKSMLDALAARYAVLQRKVKAARALVEPATQEKPAGSGM
eukprot:TRINITY_DN6934_c0_g1_i5.p1 TRINITY_DN6934_c0_g1~~TRINITY_DN6934_c0_g1_i5.p1  ORF type:complete len:590 (-),score=108.57 TRINITY_DN6934_c0_g1_i5:117-1886(-)